jgi:hypothetical protein
MRLEVAKSAGGLFGKTNTQLLCLAIERERQNCLYTYISTMTPKRKGWGGGIAPLVL